ncbi:MAG TPA: response regulator transcription factor [Candidatus Polarisedimenticolaceae bacterium]|nr:response regulator transcription factor [Candidatus Polarisedimenticolaceae bacterium]
MKILAVDDDLELLGLVAFALRQAGYLVIEAADGTAGLAAFVEERPDLVILDVNLPGMNGFQLLRELRTRSRTTPVMMLTVRSDEQDQVGALDLGADDYLTKPFSPRTLLARVRALLRRAGNERAPVARVGILSVDAERRCVTVGAAEAVHLTALEFRLLQILVANAGSVVSADRLSTHVWGRRKSGDRRALKQLIHRLRSKIELDPADPRLLVTEPGEGYRMVAEPE